MKLRSTEGESYREAFDDWFPAMAHPELIGMRTNYLPSASSIEYYDGERASCYYTYKFDEDGYLKECIVKHLLKNMESLSKPIISLGNKKVLIA